jgi:uncharacterized protein (DUF433 family)
MNQARIGEVQQIVWTDPERLSGTPCFTGTRVPVQNLLDFLEGGGTIDQFLELYPSVKRVQVISFLELAKDLVLECASP